ncbi:MAG TPA: hypothetical protein EYH31_12140 [Anaerolineae bacterium]|nr:hypothetical protein [Anaerolineae bacterium]
MLQTRWQFGLAVTLLLWFYLQGIRALFSRLFGVVYDALFVGPFSLSASLILLIAFLAFILPPLWADRVSPWRWWPILSVGLILTRLALTAENPTWRLYTSLLTVLLGTGSFALLWQVNGRAMPSLVVGALALDQLPRVLGSTLDVTLLERWWPYQLLLSLMLLALLLKGARAGDAVVSAARYLSPLGGLALAGFLLLETSLLDFPNALARWSGVNYAWAAPLLLLVTLVALWPSLLTPADGVLLRAFPTRALAIALLLGTLALGYQHQGWPSLLALLVAQWLLLWMLRSNVAETATQAGGWLALGLLLFLVLNFAYAFAFTYAYTLPFFRGAGLPIMLLAGLLAALPLLQQPISLPLPVPDRFRNPIWLGASLVLILAIGWAARPRPVRPPAADAPLHLGTYNIHYGYNAPWHFNLPAIADTIAASGADVVTLQEVDTGRITSYMVDDALWLARRLGMHVVYGPTIEHLTGIALLSRWPVAEHESRLLASQLEQTGIVRAQLNWNGREVNAYSIWLGLEPEERAKQLADALAFISERPGPASLGGDFNAIPDSPIYAQLTAAGFVDPFLALGLPHEPTDPAENPQKRIDYVWLRELRPLAARVMSTTASDHRMVVVEAVKEN